MLQDLPYQVLGVVNLTGAGSQCGGCGVEHIPFECKPCGGCLSAGGHCLSTQLGHVGMPYTPRWASPAPTESA